MPVNLKFFGCHRTFWKDLFGWCFDSEGNTFGWLPVGVNLHKRIETKVSAKWVAIMFLFKGFKPDISFPKNSFSKFTSVEVGVTNELYNKGQPTYGAVII